MKLARLAYLLACHPFRLHQALVRRGLAQKWIDDFRPFWDRVRPPSLPISDYASYTWLEYFFSARFRQMHQDGQDHFEDQDAQYARLLSYVKRREMHPLRMLKVAWHLRNCQTVLEFGAGAAPYAHFLKTAWPIDQEILVYDIPSLLFKYAKWWIGWLWPLASEELALRKRYDGIVCTEVFEHLEMPLETAKKMMQAAPMICFDYVDDGSAIRQSTLTWFAVNGKLTGPDKRGLYVWRKA